MLPLYGTWLCYRNGYNDTLYKDTDEVPQSCLPSDYYRKPDVRNRVRDRCDNGRTWLIQTISWRWTAAQPMIISLLLRASESTSSWSTSATSTEREK